MPTLQITLQHQLVLSLLYVSALAFVPEIQMPFKKILGTSTIEINTIGSTLTCDDQRSSLKDCATECYDSGCPGFYTDTTQNNECYLCHVSNRTEVVSGIFTTFAADNIIYLLKDQEAIPEVSMTFEDHSGTTISGVGTTGTTTNVQESDYVSGIKNQALYIHGGGKVHLTGSENDCWTNLDHCTSGITVSFYFKMITRRAEYIVGSGAQFQQGFNFWVTHSSYLSRFRIDMQNKVLNKHSNIALQAGQWYLLTGSYDGDMILQNYVNGVEQITDQVNQNSDQINQVDYSAHMGVKDAGSYTGTSTDAIIDEFKYYYRVLTDTEVWREFVGYDINLVRPSILASPDMVANSNHNLTALVDGNLATCVALEETTCGRSLKVKLFNSAPDKTNYTVTMVTENMECGYSGLSIKGDQRLQNAVMVGNEEKDHFLGKFRKFNLAEESQSNGQNQCVSRHMCEEGKMCYYVFVSVQDVPDATSWKVCEVLFG